ncbi:hypothetical protein H4R34_000311 [Dimargaris verticillata]|uniref:F-box domain-containing protein n=1 Tax=Dimargaris verticillata TaxID=2761393 RepID=A0A9W8BDI1_9FUNG|nr:hypothetical protein H4R34_000311 [Dimargaris verticillata]
MGAARDDFALAVGPVLQLALEKPEPPAVRECSPGHSDAATGSALALSSPGLPVGCSHPDFADCSLTAPGGGTLIRAKAADAPPRAMVDDFAHAYGPPSAARPALARPVLSALETPPLETICPTPLARRPSHARCFHPPRLPQEVVARIVAYLHQDQATLWACILVNRLWNQVATPQLWQRPRFTHLRAVEKFSETLAIASLACTPLAAKLLASTTAVSAPVDLRALTRAATHFYPDYVVHLDFTLLDENARNATCLSRLIYHTVHYASPRALRVLDLGFCRGLKNYDLQRIAPRLTAVHSLNLAGGGRQDIVLTKIVQHTPNLVRLSLSWNAQLTDFGIVQTVQRCVRLQCLDLTHCTLLEDSALMAIAAHCPELRVLSISYCHGLTDVAVLHVVKHCRQLRVLNILSCSGVTRSFIRQLMEQHPHLLLNQANPLPFYHRLGPHE